MSQFLSKHLILWALVVAFVGSSCPLPAAAQDDDVIRIKKRRTPDEEGQQPTVKKHTSTGARSLEGLLKEANLKYDIQESDGKTRYRIGLLINNQKTTVVAWEAILGKTREGDPVKAAVLVTQIAAFEEGVRPPQQMFKVICDDINDRLVIGKVSTAKAGAFFSSSFWLRTADTQTLLDHLMITHGTRLDVAKQLRPILEEASGAE